MKLILAILVTGIFAFSAFAQSASIEKNFAANIKRYKVEKYSVGEDASSGYDYLVYKRGAQIVKIRTIWSSSANPEWWIEDAYYKVGQPVLMVELSVTKRQYRSVVKGSQIALKVKDRYEFKDSKLVKWTEKGKDVGTGDARWAEFERDIFTTAKNTLEFYPEMKDQ